MTISKTMYHRLTHFSINSPLIRLYNLLFVIIYSNDLSIFSN